MANVEINIGLQVKKQTPINKGDFELRIRPTGHWAAPAKPQHNISKVPQNAKSPEALRYYWLLVAMSSADNG